MAQVASPRAHAGAAVTTVVASPGYPDTPFTGGSIRLPAETDGVVIFHAGTACRDDGTLVTSGGRVFAVTAVAGTFEAAQRASVSTAERIDFPDKVLRRDIGWRELARRAGTT